MVIHQEEKQKRPQDRHHQVNTQDPRYGQNQPTKKDYQDYLWVIGAPKR